MKLLTLRGRNGFTLLELLTVMAIIVTLAGIILAGVGFAQQKAARERATAEVHALSTAIESYKIDNGDYPRNDDTNKVSAPSLTAAPGTPGAALLFTSLKGKYFEFKGDMMDNGKIDSSSKHIVDPFGNPYGYSTRGSMPTPPAATEYYNPTFDLWSTAGATTAADKVKWITNW